MELFPFLLVVVSAFSHSFWNVLAKGGSDKEAFMWLMTLTSLFTLMPVFYLIMPTWGLPLTVWPYLIVSGIAETVYFISLGRAYELGDLSIVYPLARSSPLFLTVLAVVFLGEDVSTWGILGILLMVFAVYVIHLRSFSTDGFLQPLRSLSGRASQFAILTALCTTVYSIADKLGVTFVEPLLYAFWLEAFILIFMTPVVFLRRGWEAVIQEWRNSKFSATVGGFLMRFGYILVLLAMGLAQVSYILALRQLSIVIGAILGVLLLRERYGWIRILGSLIMFTGVYVLGVLA